MDWPHRVKFRYIPRSARLIIPIFLLLAASQSQLLATWNLITHFQYPVSCGYFFDENHGLIGLGWQHNSASQEAQIFLTSDGGATWSKAVTPQNANGSVTDIFMQTPLVGYASIFGVTETLWKTTDGGNSWGDLTFAGLNNGLFPPDYGGTCVYATSEALIFTQWNSGRISGGFSTQNGNNFTQVFADGNTNSSNGIDFTDDLHGVVTMRPTAQPDLLNYYTTNGGLTWQNSGYLPESWGVYAVKGTKTFITASEGSAVASQQNIYRSDDNGATWEVVYNFQGVESPFTGHIAGVGNTVYLQTYLEFGAGMYRSDDLGSSWTPVGGPSNSRDTRFVVTGCAGQVVYAFNDSGDVYKTTDGGDGTLTAGKPILFSEDSVNFRTTRCADLVHVLGITDGSCDSVVLDSISLLNDNNSVFSVGSFSAGTLHFGESDSLAISYTPSLAPTDTGGIVVFGHQGALALTRYISIRGSDSAGLPLCLSLDTLHLSTSYCNPITLPIPVANLSCLSIAIDSIRFRADSLHLYSVGGLPTQDIVTNSSDTLRVTFTPQADGGDTSAMIVYWHQGEFYSRNIIPVVAFNQTAPEPIVGTVLQAKAGNAAAIPIYLKPTIEKFSLSSLSLHLAFNGDVLTPVTQLGLTGTLAQGSTSATAQPTGNTGADCVLTLWQPITEASDLTQPLFYFKASVRISDSLETNIVLDKFAVNGNEPLTLCSLSSSTFNTQLICGDSLLTLVMRGASPVELLRVDPNPVSGGNVDIEYKASSSSVVSIDIVDANGKTIASPIAGKAVTVGTHVASVNTSGWPSGTYFVVLTTPTGGRSTEKLLEIR